MKTSLVKTATTNLLAVLMSASVYSQNPKDVPKENSSTDLAMINASTHVTFKGRNLEEKALSKKVNTTSKKATFNASADYVTIVDGKAFVKKNGKFLPVKDERLVEGMKILPDGQVIFQDGMEEKLQEGEAMTMEGYIVRVNQTDVLREQVKALYEHWDLMYRSDWKVGDHVVMLNRKSEFMNKKMDLVNQKMMLMVDHLNDPYHTVKERKEYEENIRLIDEEITSIEADIRDINALLPE